MRLPLDFHPQNTTLTAATLDRLDIYLDQGLGHPVPLHANPTDHALEVFNTDFMTDAAEREAYVNEYARRWESYAIENGLGHRSKFSHDILNKADHRGLGFRRVRKGLAAGISRNVYRTGILMERNTINYSRNLLAYGVRIGMYCEGHCLLLRIFPLMILFFPVGMGVMLATIWVNLAQTSAKVVRPFPSHPEVCAVNLKHRPRTIACPSTSSRLHFLVSCPSLAYRPFSRSARSSCENA